MKFSGYQRAVGLNAPQAPRVQAPRDEMAYGAGGKGLDAMAAAVGQVNKVVQKEQDDADAADVMEARNKIMTQLTNGFYGEQGLFTTGVGQNAKGLAERSNKFVKQTFDDVAKEYNGRVQKALRGNLNENMANYQRMAASQESRERENVKASEYKNGITLNADMAGKNYADLNTVDTMLDDSLRLAAARGVEQGLDGRTMLQEQQNVTSQVVGNAIDAALSSDDFDTAQELYKRYGNKMTTKDFIKIGSTLKKEQRIVEDRQTLNDIMAQCKGTNGDYDFDKASQLIDAEANATKEIVVSGGSFSGNDKIDGYIDAAAKKHNVPAYIIAGIMENESGFNQNAKSDVGAIGLMQLMPDTAAGLGVDPYNPASNVDGGANYIKQMLDSNGGNIELALAAYNAGPGAVEEFGGIPPYAETQAYVKKVMASIEKNKTKGTTKRTVRKHDAKWADDMKQKAKAMIADQQYIKRQQEDQLVQHYASQLDGLDRTGCLNLLEQISKLNKPNVYSQIHTMISQRHPGIFNVRSGGGSSAGSNGRGRTSGGQYGVSGDYYTNSEIKAAYKKWRKYNAVIKDPNSKISAEAQFEYNEAASLINDLEDNSGDDLTSEEGLELAKHAIRVHQNDEEAEWYLITNGMTPTEAPAYVKMAHSQE